MDTDERISELERKLAFYDSLVNRLVAYAKLSPKGRLMLKFLGIS